MNKCALVFSIGLLAASLAAPALAGDYGGSRMGMEPMRGGAGMGMMKGECMMDEQGMRGTCLMMGAHSMTGKVDKIDHAKGTLMLKHGASDMLLHFPPAAIKDIKDGDTITVRLGIAKEDTPK